MHGTFHGSFAALPTPLIDGELDLDSLRGLVEFQIAGGTRGVVPCGTTGEAATLTTGEFERVIRTVVDASKGRIQVIAGVGTNSTQTTIQRAQFACHAGADALLVVTPYYNRPSPEGLFQHFSALANAVKQPIVLYNVPSRTGVDLTVDLVARLTEAHSNIVAIKQASRSIARIRDLVQLGRLDVLVGEDALLFEFMQAGATGSIGVVANIVPEQIAQLVTLGNQCRAAGATAKIESMRALSQELAPLVEALFVESNPIPLKAALALMGLCQNELRLPLSPLEANQLPKLESVLARFRLLPATPPLGEPV
ncbi:MAG: 4-hydroxy-tetrahydrodipicolinate synthase [Planctomycetota bacterium]|jgi:4-hydroxy-tetrahydrodipicolinate synthase